MVTKDRIYMTFKYLGCFLACNILLWAMIWLIAKFDQDKLELIDCFAFEYGYITKTLSYQSYLQGACTYPQICTCAVNAEWILFFYIWALFARCRFLFFMSFFGVKSFRNNINTCAFWAKLLLERLYVFYAKTMHPFYGFRSVILTKSSHRWRLLCLHYTAYRPKFLKCCL